MLCVTIVAMAHHHRAMFMRQRHDAESNAQPSDGSERDFA
jgi:hypothetical protein